VKVLTSEQLIRVGQGLQEVPLGKLNQVRIMRRQGTYGPLLEFNPPIPPTSEQSKWLCGDRPPKELGLDLAEWIWKRQCSLKEVDLFNYTTKRGYKVGLQ
jgi:hypothetical protein